MASLYLKLAEFVFGRKANCAKKNVNDGKDLSSVFLENH